MQWHTGPFGPSAPVKRLAEPANDEPPIKRRRYHERSGAPITPHVDIDTNTYFHWLPMDVKRLLFLFLPTLQAQRLSAGTNVCNKEFWRKKASDKGFHPSEYITTSEDYAAQFDTAEHVLAFRYITPTNKDRILDAIANKDLDLFSYYINNTIFQRGGIHTNVIEWYAYFAGKDFYDAWIRVAIKYLGYTGYMYQIEMAAVKGDMRLFLSMEPREGYDPEIIPAVITGGNLDMLRYLLEGKLANAAGYLSRFSRVRVDEGQIWDWNVARWIACANLHGYVYTVTYLEALVRDGAPKVRLSFPHYHTVPIRCQGGGYLWRIQT